MHIVNAAVFLIQAVRADNFSLTIMLHFNCTFWACSNISVKFWGLLNCLTSFHPQSGRGVVDGFLLFEEWITSIVRKVFPKPPNRLFHHSPACTPVGWADSKSLRSSLRHTELVLNFLLSKPCCKLNQNTFIRGLKINPTEVGFYHTYLSETSGLGYGGSRTWPSEPDVKLWRISAACLDTRLSNQCHHLGELKLAHCHSSIWFSGNLNSHQWKWGWQHHKTGFELCWISRTKATFWWHFYLWLPFKRKHKPCSTYLRRGVGSFRHVFASGLAQVLAQELLQTFSFAPAENTIPGSWCSQLGQAAPAGHIA